MKKLLLVFVVFTSIFASAQDNYFLGKTNFCTPEKPESKKSLETAFLGLQFPKYYGGVTNLLVKVVKEDPGYCDAYFMAGYFFRLQDMHKEALVLYYAADSLSQNRAPIFKQNLAIQYMRFGKLDKARAKYEEMVKYFPTNPEGYYGIANTAVVIGDYDHGLRNLKEAENIYRNNGNVNNDLVYMFGMLHFLKDDYDTALPYLEKAYTTYKKDEGYLSVYSLTLIKVGKNKKDEKLIKKAHKNYEKIKGKVTDEELAKKLKNEFV